MTDRYPHLPVNVESRAVTLVRTNIGYTEVAWSAVGRHTGSVEEVYTGPNPSHMQIEGPSGTDLMLTCRVTSQEGMPEGSSLWPWGWEYEGAGEKPFTQAQSVVVSPGENLGVPGTDYGIV